MNPLKKGAHLGNGKGQYITVIFTTKLILNMIYFGQQ